MENREPTLQREEPKYKKSITEQLGIDDASIEKNEAVQTRLRRINSMLCNLPENTFMVGPAIFHVGPAFVEMIKRNPSLSEFLRNKLQDKIIVDLGCGRPGYTDAALDKSGFSPKAYIGVDINTFNEQDVTYEQKNRKIEEVAYIQEDMLRFVAKLPDGSVNFLITAVDSDVISNKEYRNMLREQIERATENGGLVIGKIVAYDIAPRFKKLPESESDVVILEKE